MNERVERTLKTRRLATLEVQLTPQDLSQIEAELPKGSGARSDVAGMAAINI